LVSNYSGPDIEFEETQISGRRYNITIPPSAIMDTAGNYLAAPVTVFLDVGEVPQAEDAADKVVAPAWGKCSGSSLGYLADVCEDGRVFGSASPSTFGSECL